MLALLGAVHEKENEMHVAARQKYQKIYSSLAANAADLSPETIQLADGGPSGPYFAASAATMNPHNRMEVSDNGR